MLADGALLVLLGMTGRVLLVLPCMTGGGEIENGGPPLGEVRRDEVLIDEPLDEPVDIEPPCQEPAGGGLVGMVVADEPYAGGLVGIGSAVRVAPTLLTGMMPLVLVLGLAKPPAAGSELFADTLAVVFEFARTGDAGGLVVAGAVLLAGMKAGDGLYRLLLVRQQSQPVRAIPAQTRPMRPTTGFLPIGIPFPVEMNHGVAPLPARACSGYVYPGISRPLSSTEWAAM